jgi:serine/threonine protein kinase
MVGMTDEGSAPRKTRLYGAIDPRELHSLEGPPTLADTNQFATVAEPLMGERLARYEIRELLGRGGMGEVLSVRDEQMGRSVAIKRLRVENPPDELVARFLREARIQGRLEHPAVVPVHELSYEPGGQPFFVMKQLSGTTFQDVLPKLALRDPRVTEQFGRQRLLRAFADICLAIEFAHTRGVVHRDLKPANIMVGDFGEVYVMDWGLAKVLKELVEHHIREEEDNIWRDVRKHCSHDDRARLDSLYLAEKRRVKLPDTP